MMQPETTMAPAAVTVHTPSSAVTHANNSIRRSWNRTRLLRSAATTFVLLVCLVFSIVGLKLVFGEIPDDKETELWLEVGKSLLYLATVVVAAGFVSQIFSAFTKSKKADTALHDFRVGYLEQIERTYREAKKVRRALRAVGLSTKYLPQTGAFSDADVKCYFDQMAILNDVQLELERLKLHLGHFPDAFTGGEKLDTTLREMEAYLRKILDEYEKTAPVLRSAPNTVMVGDLKILTDFTGAAEKSEFETRFAKQYDLAVGLVRQDLLPLRAVLQGQIQ